MILGNLVSNSKLYSYLINSFRLKTEGFLSNDLGLTNPYPICPLMPLIDPIAPLIWISCPSGDMAPFTDGKMFNY
jgi:hypothetical protein